MLKKITETTIAGGAPLREGTIAVFEKPEMQSTS